MTLQQPHEDRLYQDPELARFYDLENGFAADHAFCMQLAQNASSVLDLGCGTGELAARLADKRRVVGVDPAAAMLAVARQRPGGDKVRWITATAQAVRLGETFDLIVLTGHAFQVFLSEADQRAALKTIAMHLSPAGRFIFDMRNPQAREWLEWSPEASVRHVEHEQLGAVTAWNEATHDPATSIVTYKTFYMQKSTGRTWSARSQIRFTGKDLLAALIDEAGLVVETWHGDWTGAPCTQASPDFIPLGRLKP